MPRSLKMLRATALVLVVSAIVVAPWLFAAVEPWSYALLCMGVSAGLWLYLLSVLCEPEPHLVQGRLMGLFAMLLLLGVFQIVALPSGFLAVLSPWAAGVQRDAAGLLATFHPRDLLEPTGDSGPGGGATLSLAPVATFHSLVLFFNYGAAFWVVVSCLHSWRQVVRIVNVLVFSGCLMLVLAILHKAAGLHTILWFHEPRYGGDLLGPFTNRNHFALHMNMLCALAAGMAWVSAALLVSRSSREENGPGLRFVLDYASDLPLRVFMAAFLGAGVFFSLSRGGMLSLLASLALAGLFFVRRGGLRRRGWGRVVAATTTLLLLGMVVALGWTRVVARLASLVTLTPSSIDMGRLKVLPYVCELATTAWVAGSGFGAFQYVFPAFQGLDVQFGRWLHAHNEFLQVLAEGGWLGVFLSCLLGLCVICELRKTVRAVETRISLFGIAVVMAGVAAGLQSIFDYGLRKPANAWLLALILALGVAVRKFSWGDQDAPRMGTRTYETASSDSRTWPMRLAATGGLLVVTFMLIAEWRLFLQGLHVAQFQYLAKVVNAQTGPVLDAGVRDAMRGLARRASAHGAGEDLLPQHRREMVSTCMRWSMDRRLPEELRLDLAERAVEAGGQLVRGAPADYLGWLWLGRSLAVIGEWEDAEACVRRAKDLTVPGTRVVLFGNPLHP